MKASIITTTVSGIVFGLLFLDVMTAHSTEPVFVPPTDNGSPRQTSATGTR